MIQLTKREVSMGACYGAEHRTSQSATRMSSPVLLAIMITRKCITCVSACFIADLPSHTLYLRFWSGAFDIPFPILPSRRHFQGCEQWGGGEGWALIGNILVFILLPTFHQRKQGKVGSCFDCVSQFSPPKGSFHTCRFQPLPAY